MFGGELYDAFCCVMECRSTHLWQLKKNPLPKVHSGTGQEKHHDFGVGVRGQEPHLCVHARACVCASGHVRVRVCLRVIAWVHGRVMGE